MELSKAKSIAESIVSELKPYCEVIHIAGSVRREKPDPHDIEIVLRPKLEEVKDLFGDVIELKPFDQFDYIIDSLGKPIKGKTTGRMMQIQLPEIMLDLFMPEPMDFMRQYVVRTGSAEYSHKVIAAGWNRIGWVGTKDGLRKRTDCECKIKDGKNTWKVVNPKPELPPHWQTENEFFDWLGIKWIEPRLRTA